MVLIYSIEHDIARYVQVEFFQNIVSKKEMN